MEKKPDPQVIEQVATTESQVYKSKEPVESNIVKMERVEKPMETQTKEEPDAVEYIASDMLYTQPIANGYQLVDSTPKVVLKLEKTSIENVFLVDFKGKNGVVFKKDGKWFLEYSENGDKQIQELNIKF